MIFIAPITHFPYSTTSCSVSLLCSLFCSMSLSHFVSLSFSLLLPLHFQRFIKRHLKFKYGHKCRCVQLCRNAGNAKTNDSPSDPPIVNSSGQALTPWHRRKYNNKNSNRDNNNDNNSAQTYSKKMFGSENYKPLEHILQVPALGRRSGHTRPAQKQEQGVLPPHGWPIFCIVCCCCFFR